MEGYVEGERDSASHLQEKRQAGKLIELFGLERALYEIRHELNDRPSWISIPAKEIIDRVEDSTIKDAT